MIHDHPGTAHGFFQSPQMWIGEAPPDGRIRQDSPGKDDVVVRQKLRCGLEGLAYRDGLFMFDFKGSGLPADDEPPDVSSGDTLSFIVKRSRSRVVTLNAFLACLYSSLRGKVPTAQHFVTVKPSTMVSSMDLDDTLFGTGDPLVALKVLSQPRRHVSWVGEGPMLKEYWWPIDYPTPIPVVQSALEMFDDLLSRDPDERAQLTELVLRSLEGFVAGDYVLSLLSSWAVLERLLNVMWRGYLDEAAARDEPTDVGVKFINKDRRDILDDGRSFTTSVMAESLSLLGVLPFGEYVEITRARKARNNWLHNLATPTLEQADAAFSAAVALLRKVHGVALNLHAR